MGQVLLTMHTFVIDNVVMMCDVVMKCDDNVNDLRNEAAILRAKAEDLAAKIEDVKRQGKEVTSQVTWLAGAAKEAVDKADATVEIYEKMPSLCFEGFHPNIVLVYGVSTQAAKVVAEVKRLSAEGGFAESAKVSREESEPRRAVARPVESTSGFEVVLERLRQLVADEEVCRIGVFGMGGMGKTVLLKALNNELRDGAIIDSKPLGYVIWVEVPGDSSVDEVQKIICEQLALPILTTAAKRASLITAALNQSSFALILDGLWKHINLLAVGIPMLRPPCKSKVILSARLEEVCDLMDVDEQAKVELKGMEWKEAWKLFEQKAGKELVGSNKEILKRAKVLVAKCGGLPFALVNLGRAMASRKTLKEWDNAVTTIDVAPWELLGNEVFERLKPSFDNLPSDSLRETFLYCSLYPEGLSLFKEWIIDYSIGEGIIDDESCIDRDELYNKGHELLGRLQSASLLKNGEDEQHVKMHPVIRGLALWIAAECGNKSNKWLVRPGGTTKLDVAPRAQLWREAERISLMRNDIRELDEEPECPNLKTLFLQRNLTLNLICDEFFNSMTKLRVLDLSHTAITELPESIEVAAELHYLDLCGSNVKALPKGLGKLKKLRFLLLSHMRQLKTIPDGVISALSTVQVFYMDASYGNWKVGDSAGDGVDFDELKALRSLIVLGLTVEMTAVLRRLVNSRILSRCARNLQIHGCEGLSSIQLPPKIFGKNMDALENLRIKKCEELDELKIEDDGRGSLSKLQAITLERVDLVKIYWYGGTIPSLTYLKIWMCKGMEQLIYGNDDPRNGEKEEEDEGPKSPFPNLRLLELIMLPELKSLTSWKKTIAFPALETLTVFDCPKLTKLSIVSENLKTLRGGREWWEGVECASEEAKTKLHGAFKALN